LLRRPSVVYHRVPHQFSVSGDSLMRRLTSDLRYAVRVLVSQPRFTVIAALTLAIGVSASIAIFAVVNGILLQPLPYPNGDRLVNVWSHAPKLGYDQFPLSPDMFFLYERDNDVFD